MNKQHGKILTFEYPIMSQYNNPKINLQKTHNVKRNTIIASRVTHVTLGLADPSFINIILPSEVQTSLKPYSYLASFSFVIRKEVKLSVTYICSFKLSFIHENFSPCIIPGKLNYYSSTFLTLFIFVTNTMRSINIRWLDT